MSESDTESEAPLKQGTSLSLRWRTILLFSALLVLAALVVIAVAFVLLKVAFLGVEAHNTAVKVQIVAESLRRNVAGMHKTILDYCYWDLLCEAITSAETNHSTLADFTNNSFIRQDIVTCSGLWTASGKLVYSHCNDIKPPDDFSDPTFVASMGTTDFSGVMNFPGIPPMYSAFHAVYNGIPITPNDRPIEGYVFFGTDMQRTLPEASTVAQGCVAIVPINLTTSVPATVARRLLSVSASANSSLWGKGEAVISTVTVGPATDSELRSCYNSDSENKPGLNNAGYILLRDPIPSHVPGPVVRVDHERAVYMSGGKTTGILIVVFIIALTALGVGIVAFIDVVVLGRLSKLKSELKRSIKEARRSEEADEGGAKKPRRGDEISRLEVLLQFKMRSIEKEFMEASEERRGLLKSIERLNSASAMLNVLCGRDTQFPADELLPTSFGDCTSAVTKVNLDAAQSPSSDDSRGAVAAATPGRQRVNLAGIVESPLAVEFLKSHCRTTENGIGPVLFLLDVMQLMDETGAASVDKRLAKAAGMYRRYISSNAIYHVDLVNHKWTWIKDAIRSKTDMAAVSLLESVSDEVSERLAVEVLPRFEMSEEYPNLMRVLREECGGPLPEPYVTVDAAASAQPFEDATKDRHHGGNGDEDAALGEQKHTAVQAKARACSNAEIGIELESRECSSSTTSPVAQRNGAANSADDTNYFSINAPITGASE